MLAVHRMFGGLCADKNGGNHEYVCGQEGEIGLPLPPGRVATTCAPVFYLTVGIDAFRYLHRIEFFVQTIMLSESYSCVCRGRMVPWLGLGLTQGLVGLWLGLG